MSKLPILMYHNINPAPEKSSGLCISVEKFEQQCAYIQKKYTTYHFSELENRQSLTTKSLIITFDDVTENQLLYAVPILEKYNLKATFFIPFAYVGATDLWNNGTEKIMTVAQLKRLPKNIELGLHSYHHKKYSSLTTDEIQADFEACFDWIKHENIAVFNALAYPYGNYPKKKPLKNLFFKQLQQNNMVYGLRIGNKLNKFPFKNPFEIKRLDIKGDYSFVKFWLKITFGKFF